MRKLLVLVLVLGLAMSCFTIPAIAHPPMPRPSQTYLPMAFGNATDHLSCDGIGCNPDGNGMWIFDTGRMTVDSAVVTLDSGYVVKLDMTNYWWGGGDWGYVLTQYGTRGAVSRMDLENTREIIHVDVSLK